MKTTITADPLLKQTSRFISDEALARGWQVEVYYEGSSHMRLTRPDGRVLETWSAVPPTTSQVAGMRADNKYLTGLILGQHGIRVPKSVLVQSADEAVSAAHELLANTEKLVIKPLSASHGHGVTVGLQEESEIRDAYSRALQYSAETIVQEHIQGGTELRVTCIDFKVVGALLRIPARVIGNGTNTARQLIELANADPRRGENYSKALSKIDADQAAAFLGAAIDQVPPAHQAVTVIGTANLGTGGETQDITALLPLWLVELSQKVAHICDLPCLGIDYLVSQLPHPDISEGDLNPIIVEVNKCPALFMHETPTYGESRQVIKAYVDYLAQL